MRDLLDCQEKFMQIFVGLICNNQSETNLCTLCSLLLSVVEVAGCLCRRSPWLVGCCPDRLSTGLYIAPRSQDQGHYHQNIILDFALPLYME